MSTPNGHVLDELPAANGTALHQPTREPSMPRLLWDAWKAYAHRAGRYQAQVLLTIVYYVVLGPSAYASRLGGNTLLDLSTAPRPSYWIDRRPAEKSLRAMERQF